MVALTVTRNAVKSQRYYPTYNMLFLTLRRRRTVATTTLLSSCWFVTLLPLASSLVAVQQQQQQQQQPSTSRQLFSSTTNYLLPHHAQQLHRNPSYVDGATSSSSSPRRKFTSLSAAPPPRNTAAAKTSSKTSSVLFMSTTTATTSEGEEECSDGTTTTTTEAEGTTIISHRAEDLWNCTLPILKAELLKRGDDDVKGLVKYQLVQRLMLAVAQEQGLPINAAMVTDLTEYWNSLPLVESTLCNKYGMELKNVQRYKSFQQVFIRLLMFLEEEEVQEEEVKALEIVDFEPEKKSGDDVSTEMNQHEGEEVTTTNDSVVSLEEDLNVEDTDKIPQSEEAITSLEHWVAQRRFVRRLRSARSRATTPTSTPSTTTQSSAKSLEKKIDDGDCGVCQNMMYRIREVNKKVPDDVFWLPFVVDGEVVGKVTEGWVEIIERIQRKRSIKLLDSVPEDTWTPKDPYPKSTFHVAWPSSLSDHSPYLTFNDHFVGTSLEDRTAAVSEIMNELRENGHISGWRDELYPISSSFYDEPKFLMERAAVPILGGLEYGVHINGLVRVNDEVKMWMARRSPTKSKYPGMVDHIVAGGIPYGISLYDNVLKECMEEAGIPPELVDPKRGGGLKPTGVISYETFVESKQVISRAVLFNYDLLLPNDFVPKPVDGEVEEFFMWDMDQIMESFDPSFDDPIKPNCYAVIIDYLVREGHVGGDTPGYLDVIRELRSGQCV